jgi:hypothetical protein
MKVFVIFFSTILALSEANGGRWSNGLVRFQRGDQGPDDDLLSPDDQSSSIINSNTSSRTDLVLPPIGGPNVCRSRSRTFCCPGWHQRGATGLCLVPICASNRCGLGGRCIKPNLCLCDGGKIANQCGNSNNLIENGKTLFKIFKIKNQLIKIKNLAPNSKIVFVKTQKSGNLLKSKVKTVITSTQAAASTLPKHFLKSDE